MGRRELAAAFGLLVTTAVTGLAQIEPLIEYDASGETPDSPLYDFSTRIAGASSVWYTDAGELFMFTSLGSGQCVYFGSLENWDPTGWSMPHDSVGTFVSLRSRLFPASTDWYMYFENGVTRSGFRFLDTSTLEIWLGPNIHTHALDLTTEHDFSMWVKNSVGAAWVDGELIAEGHTGFGAAALELMVGDPSFGTVSGHGAMVVDHLSVWAGLQPSKDLSSIGFTCQPDTAWSGPGLPDSLLVGGVFGNVGDVSVEAFFVRIEINECPPHWSDTRLFGPLAPGQTDTIFAGPFPVTPSQCTATLIIDYLDQIPEADETNNVISDEPVCTVINTPEGTTSTQPVALRIFPNPAVGPLRIAHQGLSQPRGVLRIYDATGRQVWGGLLRTRSGLTTWDGATTGGQPVAPGVYFIRLETPDQTALRRLVVVK